MSNVGEENKDEIRVSATVEELLLAALDRDDKSLKTGRNIITFHENAVEEGISSIDTKGFNVKDARDFKDQAVSLDRVGSRADALIFPEIRSALVSDAVVQEIGIAAQVPGIKTIEPEYFAFAVNSEYSEYFRGFISAANAIANDLGTVKKEVPEKQKPAQVRGVTWGLKMCKVPTSSFSGSGIKVAILDTGFDTEHPDFEGRSFTTNTFVEEPVQDLHGHGTHTTGTACGPKEPSTDIPRYGIAFECEIFVGKVLTNSGVSVTGSILAGINWAVANRCEVISMSLGAQTPVQSGYTDAGSEALAKGCLIIAAAGNFTDATGSPANSPTIMAVSSLDPTSTPSSFSDYGKIEISAPGRNVCSSLPRPRLYGTMSGTSMAAPHVAGCAALWAQSNPTLRGMNLWHSLQSSALNLNLEQSKVGSGLVQAPQ